MIRDKEETLFEYANEILTLCGRKNLKVYDGFVPLIDKLYSQDYGIFTDVKISDLTSKPNISVLVLGNTDGIGAKKECQFLRFSEMTPKQFRKKCGLFTPKPYILETMFETRTKPLVAPFSTRNGNLTILEPPNLPPISNRLREELYISAQNLLGVQFNLENQPRVYLKPSNDRIGFTLPIENLSQLKELFSLREIPDGRKRRLALLHWVSKHLRTKPSNPDEKVEVKKYLRGQTDFEWFGLKGTILGGEN